MSTLLQEIEAQIARVKTGVARQNVGVVREIGDGVAKIEGLTDAMLNEMLDFGDGVTGLALNLEETEVGAIILGDSPGDQGRPGGPHHRQAALRCPVGKGLLGRVVNSLGQPIDGKGPITARPPSTRLKRSPRASSSGKSVSQPVQTGIMAD